MVEIERVPTGIPGLDKLIEGGLIRNSSTLLSGNAGSGRAVFCLQYLWNGATQFNEPGVYLSLEERKDHLKRTASLYGWDFDRLEKEGKIEFLHGEPYEFGQYLDKAEEVTNRLNAKRVVIDSETLIGLSLDKVLELRMKLYDIVEVFEKLGLTSIFTSEIPMGSQDISQCGVEEFVMDNVIVLWHRKEGDTYKRALEIPKMRDTESSEKVHNLKITKKGIVVE